MRVAFKFNRITDILKLAIAHNTLVCVHLCWSSSERVEAWVGSSWQVCVFIVNNNIPYVSCCAAPLKTGTLLSSLASIAQHSISRRSHLEWAQTHAVNCETAFFFPFSFSRRKINALILSSPLNALARATHSHRRAHSAHRCLPSAWRCACSIEDQTTQNRRKKHQQRARGMIGQNSGEWTREAERERERTELVSFNKTTRITWRKHKCSFVPERWTHERGNFSASSLYILQHHRLCRYTFFFSFTENFEKLEKYHGTNSCVRCVQVKISWIVVRENFWMHLTIFGSFLRMRHVAHTKNEKFPLFFPKGIQTRQKKKS